MTLVFNKNAWHYWLVMYTFGEEFFTEIDWDQTLKTSEAFHDIQWVRKTKTVNLCPYCRAVVGSIISLPFIFVWRLFPHKENKKETHQEIMKRSKRNSTIVRLGAVAFMGFIGILKVWEGDYNLSIFYFALVVFNLFNIRIFQWILKHLPKHKKKKTTKSDSKEPSKIIKKIEQHHDVLCPPIFFIDAKKDSELK